MMIIGPIIAIPRIVTLSHTMIAPFMPFEIIRDTSSLFGSCFFAIIFLGITFLATFRENRIVDVLGNVISPLLLLSLCVIITKGIFSAECIVPTLQTPLDAFKTNLVVGYETLDLLGAIFFSSIMLHILHNTLGGNVGHNKRTLAIIGLKAGGIGLSLLGIVYVGLSILGMYHGHGLMDSNAGELFREIAFKVLGAGGALVIATAVLMACLSTSIALAAIRLAMFLRSSSPLQHVCRYPFLASDKCLHSRQDRWSILGIHSSSLLPCVILPTKRLDLAGSNFPYFSPSCWRLSVI
jgi:LIVCS family branched-chain amino acid:cation transporter